ncbi:hypothetical protein D3C78_1475830 [compost metagenome]
MAVVVAGGDGAVGVLLDVGERALGDVLLRAFDESGVGQRGQRLGAEVEQILTQ